MEGEAVVGLSHMTDAYIREHLLVCPPEVKAKGEDYNEAVCHPAVQFVAVFEKSRLLAKMVRD